jgi:HAMP domain-containing protein
MSQVYFKINLNKYGELRRKIEREKNVFRNTAIIFGFLTLLLFIFALILNGSMQKKVNNRRQLLSDIRKEIKSYQVSGDFLSSNDLERLHRISTERIFWARKLVALSEQTTDKIAITHFSFKSDVLTLYGITKLDREEKEFDLIDDFITKLKNNPEISSDFPEIKIVMSRKDKEKDVEILRFQIDCLAEDRTRRG